MKIKHFKSTFTICLVLVGNISFGMQQKTSNLTLQFVTATTYFNHLEPKEIRNLALTCKQVRKDALEKRPELWETIGSKLFTTYIKVRNLHIDCIFLHCVYHSKYSEVEWLLKNKTIFPLFIKDHCSLDGYDVAQKKKDHKMLALLNEHKAIRPSVIATNKLINHDLIINTACMGELCCLENIPSDPDYESLENKLLVICAALKNRHPAALKNLRGNFLYALRMINYSHDFLTFICTKYQIETTSKSREAVESFEPTQQDIDFFEQIVNHGLFHPNFTWWFYLKKKKILEEEKAEKNEQMLDKLNQLLTITNKVFKKKDEEMMNVCCSVQ